MHILKYSKLFTQNPEDYIFSVDEECFDWPQAMISFKKLYIEKDVFWDREIDSSFLGHDWTDEDEQSCFTFDDGCITDEMFENLELYREEMRRRLIELGLTDLRDLQTSSI